MLSNEDSLLLEHYLDAVWMEKGLSQNTLESYRADLAAFGQWLNKSGTGFLNVDPQTLLHYLAYRHEQKISSRSTARFLSCVRGFYRYQLREGIIKENPLALVENPKLQRALPKSLTEADVESLLDAPTLDDPIGLRDRTMLEVLYACGLRVTELVSLQMSQVNLRQYVLRVMG